VLTIDGIHIFVNVIIIDLTCVNFISQAVFFRGIVVTIATQAKVVSYSD
jgi:hypothetical protein